MKVSYGPPGHRGVTQLMAVGADDFELNKTEKMVKTGGLIAIGIWGLGMIMGSNTVKNIGFGGALALFGVQAVSGGGTRVEVSKTIPPTNGY